MVEQRTLDGSDPSSGNHVDLRDDLDLVADPFGGELTVREIDGVVIFDLAESIRELLPESTLGIPDLLTQLALSLESPSNPGREIGSSLCISPSSATRPPRILCPMPRPRPAARNSASAFRGRALPSPATIGPTTHLLTVPGHSVPESQANPRGPLAQGCAEHAFPIWMSADRYNIAEGVYCRRGIQCHDRPTSSVPSTGRRCRLGIVSLLRQRPLCVWELQGHLGRDQAVVSKHLSFLKSAGIVSVTTGKPSALLTGDRQPVRRSPLGCVDTLEDDDVDDSAELIGAVQTHRPDNSDHEPPKDGNAVLLLVATLGRVHPLSLIICVAIDLHR